MFCRSIGLIGLQRTGRQIRQIQSFKHTTVLGRNLSAPTKLETVFLDPSPKSSPYVLSKEQELKITKNNHGRSLKLSELLLKLYMKREQGFWLPKEMRLEDLELMLELYGQKLDKYLLLVNKRCKYDSEFQEKKKESQEVRAELTKIREATPEEHPWLTYHLFGNALFPRMYKRSWVATYNLHMARALQMGQKIVIDCGYDEFMGDHQIKNLARQIIMCLGINLANKRPFAMYLCQLMKEGKLMYYLRRLNPLIEVQPNIVLHSGSYFDLFEKKKLVYLTPHTHLPLQYDPDDIFIIGGIVDRDKSLQLSSKKAAKEGIRYACFPLDQHLKWRKGSKLLCVHHSFNILLDLKNTRDWGKALNASVPRRHLNP